MARRDHSTFDLLDEAEHITAGCESWPSYERESFVDADLADIVQQLEARGYRSSWAHWVETGEWESVR